MPLRRALAHRAFAHCSGAMDGLSGGGGVLVPSARSMAWSGRPRVSPLLRRGVGCGGESPLGGGERLLDRPELARGESTGGERIRIYPAGPNLAIDGLRLRGGDGAVVHEPLDVVQERLRAGGRFWRLSL